MLYNIHTQITQSRLSVRIVMLILFLSGFKNIFAQAAYLPIPSSGNTYEITGWEYNPNFVIVGNFDGDALLDFAIKTMATSSNSSKIEVRNYNGNLLWQFDTQGTLEQMQDSYSTDHEPFLAWDMDQDGIDELLTVQFRGNFSSHEVYFVMLDGPTGAIRGEIHQPIVIDLDWESRRYACIAYLDGSSGIPYFCVGTGIYQEESYVFAFFWNGSNLELKWSYNHQTAYPGAVSSGTHELGSFDVDNDGKDEVLFGGTCINNNGTGRWSLSQLGAWGHEDIMQYGDLYPSNPGNEVVYGSESPGDDGCTTGIIMVDASTGSEIWSYPGNQFEKGWVGNYTNDYPGCEVRMRSSPDDCGQCCVDVYLKSDGTDIGGTFPNEEGHPYDWNGDDLYEWSDGLLGSWAWAADLTNPSQNHGAEETIWADASGKKVTVHFNKNANSYPSRWENLHYRQDVQRISACGHARWHTIPVVHGTCDATNELTVNISPAGGGIVTPASGTMYCDNTVVQLTASPNIGYMFDSWSGDISGSANPTNITMSSNKTVTANFSPAPQYTLMVTTSGSGSVTLNPSDGIYDANTVVTLTATPDAGSQFDNWTGDLTGIVNPETITMDANKTVTAYFIEIPPVAVYDGCDANIVTGICDNIHAGYTGAGFADTDNQLGTYVEWTNVYISETKSYNCTIRFANGSAADRTTDIEINGIVQTSLTFEVTGAWTNWSMKNFSLTLNTGTNTFKVIGTNPESCPNIDKLEVEMGVQPPQYTLTVNTTGSGSVALDPTGGTYNSGTAVTLTATPDAGNQFDIWTGDLTGTVNPETITMDSDKTVTANFSPLPQYMLTVNTSGPGSVSLDPPGGTYDSGTVVTLTATPDAGYQFDNWTGDITGAANPETITMDADKTVTANFSAIPQIVVYDGCGANIVTGDCETQHAGYTGAGYANTTNSSGTYVEWTNVTSSATQSCNCTIRFANGTGQARPADIEINGSVQTSLSFESTGQWTNYSTKAFSVTLNAGTNNFKVIGTGNQGCPNIDKLEVESGPTPTQYTLTVNTSGNGSVSLNPSGGIYNEGTVVTLTANPDAGNQFDNWTGDLTGTVNPETITMNADKTVTANFSVIQYTLTVNTSGNGSVSLNPAGGTYDSGTVVTLTATPDAGNQFDIWTGDLTGTANPATITMDANKTVTASFSVIQYALTVNISGNGSVTLNPPGGTYNTGTVVTLTATPNAENQFDNWTGDLTGTASPATITMDANKTVTANFSVIQYTLTVNTSGNGSVSLNPAGGTYNSGTVVTLTATPDAGNQFDNWTGDLTGTTNPVTITMDANKTVTANFSAIPQYTLTVNTAGSGSVSLNPAGGTYDSGTVVTLTATPDAGNQFDNWTGDLTGTVNPGTITMDADKTVTANFSPVPQYTLTVNTVGSGSVSLNPTGGTYDSGTVVTLTTTPDTGWSFDNWSGDLTGVANPENITMDADKTVTATFIEGGVPADTIEVRISVDDDDVEERNGSSMAFGSSDLELCYDGSTPQKVGMRFNPVNIPQGAPITNAYIQFQCDETGSSATNLTVHGEAADNASVFTTTSGDISARALTTASTTWNNVPAWNTAGEAGPNQRTPDISSIIQEIVNRSGWASGNALVLIVSGTGTRTTEAHNGDPAGAPLLHVEFGGGPPPPQYNLTVNTAGSGSVSLNPSGGTYNTGTVVTLTATPDAGNQFDNWSGDLSGSANPETITMDADKNVTATFSEISGEQAFQQDSGSDGIVSIEAEHYDDNVSQDGYDWTSNTTGGYSGDGAMEATPNTGACHNTNYAASSPRMDFKVNFVKTGTHYIWARGIGPSVTDDSYHAGLNGQEISTCDRIGDFNTSWGWLKSTMDGPDATFEVTSTGVHTVNVWMREDGIIIDKLVLTVSSSYTPSGIGPAESSRGPAKASQPAVETVEIEQLEVVIPDELTLVQNFPNPFNPSTTITYSLPQASHVKLTIYDMNGRFVSMLVNDVQNAGEYRHVWEAVDPNGNQLPSGMYLCRFQAGSHVETIKMMFMR